MRIMRLMVAACLMVGVGFGVHAQQNTAQPVPA